MKSYIRVDGFNCPLLQSSNQFTNLHIIITYTSYVYKNPVHSSKWYTKLRKTHTRLDCTRVHSSVIKPKPLAFSRIYHFLFVLEQALGLCHSN